MVKPVMETVSEPVAAVGPVWQVTVTALAPATTRAAAASEPAVARAEAAWQVVVTGLAPGPRAGTIWGPVVAQLELEQARQAEATALVSAPHGAEAALEPASETEMASQLALLVAERTGSRLAPAGSTASEPGRTPSRPAPAEAAARSEPATEPGSPAARLRAPAAPAAPALSRRRRRLAPAPSCADQDESTEHAFPY